MHEPAIADRTLVDVGRVSIRIIFAILSPQRKAILVSDVYAVEPFNICSFLSQVTILWMVFVTDHFGPRECVIMELEISSLDCVEDVLCFLDPVMGVLAVVLLRLGELIVNKVDYFGKLCELWSSGDHPRKGS